MRQADQKRAMSKVFHPHQRKARAMSDAPLTPEERTTCILAEVGRAVKFEAFREICERHIAAAVADARKDEREKIIMQIEQQIPSDLSRVHWSHVAQFKAIQQIIQQEPTQ